MTTAIIEFTPAQIAHRNACAFLKGILCGYAEYRGHKYHTTKERTLAFDAGFKIGLNRLNCECLISADDITAIHIIHNRLRHNRPHISAEYDARNTGWTAERLIKKHLGENAYALAMEQAEADKEALTNG